MGSFSLLCGCEYRLELLHREGERWLAALGRADGAVIDVLENGKTIFIDEFGTYIHPMLTHAIVSLFGDSNSDDAYMVLMTYGTTMLRELVRDEVVLVEKNHGEESFITPLVDLGVRDGETFEKCYLAGLYGGVPITSHLIVSHTLAKRV